MEQIPTRVDGFLLERIDDEVLLYHPNLAKSIRLNDAASMIWELCDGERSADAITGILVDAYPDDRQQIEVDVERVIRQLADEGALVLT